MITLYFRSSSYNQYDLCQQSYFIEYVLGHKAPSGHKAELGSCFHKVMECLAHAKKAEQEKYKLFEDEELGVIHCHNRLYTNEFVDEMIDRSYVLYSNNTIHKWTKGDNKKIKDWVYYTLAYNNGCFDPRNRNILFPEMHFDIEIPEKWAEYEFTDPITSEKIGGKLRLKGTIDLITLENEEPLIWEVLDYKSGRSLDWATGENKDFQKLCADPQLRIYHYALSLLYPNISQFIMSIFYINDSGPHSLVYDTNSIKDTKLMLEKRFNEVKQNIRPKLIKGTKQGWKCKSFCYFGKNNYKNTDKTICDHIHTSIRKYGLDKTIEREHKENHDFLHYKNPGSV